jgi:hypothetical protein
MLFEGHRGEGTGVMHKSGFALGLGGVVVFFCFCAQDAQAQCVLTPAGFVDIQPVAVQNQPFDSSDGGTVFTASGSTDGTYAWTGPQNTYGLSLEYFGMNSQTKNWIVGTPTQAGASPYGMDLEKTPAWMMVQANPQIGCACPAAGPQLARAKGRAVAAVSSSAS